MPELPINVKDLLHRRTIEGERVEFKTGWNPVAIVRTLCAFANDFENLGGGYIVIGQVRVNPESIEMVSYPGPEPSIRNEQLQTGRVVPRRYRNRRIGELLKELELTEGRGTGFPKIERAMKRNGSPPAIFSTDEGRSHFLVTLPIHPEMVGVIGKSGVDPEATTDAVWIEDKAKMAGLAITDRQRALMRILLKHKQIALGDIMEHMSDAPTPRTIQRDLQRLREAGLVDSTGTRKGAKWSIRKD